MLSYASRTLKPLFTSVLKPKPILRVKKRTATQSLPAQTAVEANRASVCGDPDILPRALVESLSHLSSLLSSPPILCCNHLISPAASSISSL